MPDLGTMAYQNADDVHITGGSITGLDSLAAANLELGAAFSMVNFSASPITDIYGDEMNFKRFSGSSSHMRLTLTDVELLRNVQILKDVRSRGQARFTGWYDDKSLNPEGPGVEIGAADGVGPVIAGYDRTDPQYTNLTAFAAGLIVNIGAETTEMVARFTTAGLEIEGQVECDSLRVNGTATNSTETPTKKLAINVGGTTYYIPLIT